MDTKTPQTAVSRRELLKALAASSGALTVAAFLPGKWAKPRVEAGVLPAHAQSTTCEATIEVLTEGGFCEESNVDCPPGFEYWVDFGYTPPNLTVSRVTLTFCQQTQQTSFAMVSPGIFRLFYNPLTNGCQDPDPTLTVDFREGCSAVFTGNNGDTRSRNGLFR
jgi:hypothetical protein